MTELTAREQLMLEMVNRARLDPLAEASRLGIALNAGLAAGQLDGVAKQPLAPNELLRQAAFDHSTWMLANDIFSHTGAGASDAGDRMTAAGYNFTGSWTWGENIAWSGSTAAINGDAYTIELADNLFRSAPHRVNILDGDFRELGTGIAQGRFLSGGTNYNALMGTQNFATSGPNVFVTGVAINDADGDNFYDIGEARAGVIVTVTIGGVTAGSDSTATAGGYSVGVAGGTAGITFSGGPLAAAVSVTVATGGSNVKVDLIGDHEIASSQSIVLGDGAYDLVLLGNAAISGTGNVFANVLVGNRGSNGLAGLDGNDVLVGGGGRDYLAGGTGHDVFDFNTVSESGRKAGLRDRIVDFAHGQDDMNVAGIDANLMKAGNQAFVWRGGAAFNGHAGQLRFVLSNQAGTANDHTFVYGDINGDKKPDFQIELDGLQRLTAGDFVL